MSDEKIRIERHELFDPEVDKALAREKQGRERIVADAPPVSPVRRLFLNSLFHLPLAAGLAALTCWLLLEPKIDDLSTVGGTVDEVDEDTFVGGPGFISYTIGPYSVLLHPDKVDLEPGTDGQPALTDARSIQPGDRIEVVGIEQGATLVAAAVRPTGRSEPYGVMDQPQWPMFILFPLTAALIAFGLLFAEGVTTRNWLRMIERTLLGSFMSALFALLALIPAGICMMIANSAFEAEVKSQSEAVMITIRDVGGWSFFLVTVGRSAAWACVGAATGLGMNLVRSTRTQLRNSTLGGALGGALGGMFFDPIDRFMKASLFTSSAGSRLVGLLAVGLAIGVFVALVERLARDAWLRVRTGPLAGKSFILYKTPTVIGNAPSSDVYLYKDAEIDPSHAQVHRVGTTYEIEDLGSRMGTEVGGSKVRRRRLVSGDQIVIGSTILDFEERQKRQPVA